MQSPCLPVAATPAHAIGGSTSPNPSWQCRRVSVRDPNAPELRAVAPLVALADGGTPNTPPRFVAPITLIANGARVIGVTSAETLRSQPDARLAVATKLDGSAPVEVVNWNIGRYSGVALVELDGFPASSEVVPLSIGAVHASVNIHGAPAAIVTLAYTGGRYQRSLVSVFVDADDAGGMSDHVVYLASPQQAGHTHVSVEGATLFAWLPPEPALGRHQGEVVAFALGYPYRMGIAKPRETPVIAELASLEDLGRALITKAPVAVKEPELPPVTGEIVDKSDPDDPLDGL